MVSIVYVVERDMSPDCEMGREQRMSKVNRDLILMTLCGGHVLSKPNLLSLFFLS
jgi:hypothetical protein